MEGDGSGGGGQGDIDGQEDKEWTNLDIEQLVEGISEHQNDWDRICQEPLNGKFTTEQCVLKFLELPLTENMLAKISGNQQQNVQSIRNQADAAGQSQILSKQACPSVLMDTSNPLFS